MKNSQLRQLIREEIKKAYSVNESFTKDDWDVKWKLPKDNLFNASKSIDAVNNRSNAIQDLLKLNPKALQAFNNDDEHPAMKMSYNELMRWYYPIMKESEDEGTYRVYMNSDPDEPERINYEIYFGDGTKAEMIKQAKEMAYSNDPTNQYGDPILVKVTHEDDIDDVAFTNVPVNEVADPSALELVGALSTIIGGSLGIKFGMDLLIKIVDKTLAATNYTATEILKIVKNNTAPLKAAAQEGKRAFVKKLMSLIINPTTTTSDYLDRIPKDPPFTIKRNEGTCGYDTDARTGKRFKTPGGL